MSLHDDSLEFAAEAEASALPPWRVLVVDDDPEVHEVTHLVLGGFRFEQRPLQLCSALSAREALELLRHDDDIAVILLDVVMESDQAGLDLVRRIREELGNSFVRIVLRTGQPGQAPEHEVIAGYDINDYKEKTELTAQRLATTLYAALRAYRDMRTIEAHRRGLERVIRASSEVFSRQNPREFASAVLEQLSELVGVEHGALCCRVDDPRHASAQRFAVQAATGEFRRFLRDDAAERLPAPVAASLRQAWQERRHVFGAGHYVLHFADSHARESLLYVGESWNLSALDCKLVEIFCTNVSIAFENLHLNEELFASQLDMVHLLAGAAETRSQETANHAKRVGLLAEMLGRAHGMDESAARLLRFAAALHDIGKIGIPDAILNKPGAHSAEEERVMRTHAELGARLLGGSGRPLLRLAAEIAHTHHENWDGSGYPRGLAGTDIPLSGRITMVADVFDALGSRRCYKQAWDSTEIRAHLVQLRARKFDPHLVDLLLQRWEEALQLREQWPD